MNEEVYRAILRRLGVERPVWVSATLATDAAETRYRAVARRVFRSPNSGPMPIRPSAHTSLTS